MTLSECSVVVGDTFVYTDPIKVHAYNNAVLVPQMVAQDDDLRWGAYHIDGSLIESAAYKRGPGRNLVGHSNRMTYDANALVHIPGRHIYGGAIHLHYGYHLLGVLPRYWLVKSSPLFSAKIAIHAYEITVRDWLEIDFVKSTIGRLGLAEDDFVVISKEAFYEQLVVPEASFIELSCVNLEFTNLLSRIGRGAVRSKNNRSEPLFLSKMSLRSGVSKIVNEDIFVDRLVRAGVRVVEPQLLKLEEQIALLSEHGTISGMLGSALHTTMFVEDKKRIVALAPDNSLPSNFLLADRLRGHSGKYVYPVGEMKNLGPTGLFQVTWEMERPTDLAESFLKLLD